MRDNHSVGQRLKILVVEDDPIYAHFIVTTLGDAGHDMTLARDAATALELARVDVPDAIVLDLRLPGNASGYDVARVLRRDVLGPGAVIIVLTAELYPHLDSAAAVDVDLVLNKPVDPDLVRGLVDHVRQRRQRRLPPR